MRSGRERLELVKRCGPWRRPDLIYSRYNGCLATLRASGTQSCLLRKPPGTPSAEAWFRVQASFFPKSDSIFDETAKTAPSIKLDTPTIAGIGVKGLSSGLY
jgi:hypothetical protein